MDWYKALREDSPIWMQCAARMEIVRGIKLFLAKRKWLKIKKNWPKKLRNV